MSSCHRHEDGSDKTGQPPGLLILGTCLVIGASFVSTFGVNLQKLAHVRNERLPPEHRQPYAKLFTWQLGMLLMVLGSVMDIVALPFVPQSRVAVLGSVTMVANVVITPVFLKETLTKHDLAGCAITVAGCTMASWFGAHVEADLTPECLVESLTQPGFLLYFSLVLVYLAGLMLLILARQRRQDLEQLQSLGTEHTKQTDGFELFGAPEEAAQPLAPDPSFLDSLPVLSTKHDSFIYASFAGTAGAQSIMFAKGALEMGYSAVTGKSSVWYLFLCLPPFGLCLWCQVHYLNQALKLFDALYVVPVYQIFWIVMGILSGLIFYQEYRNLDPVSSWMFSVGCVITLVGVITLSRRQSNPSKSLEMKAAPDSNLSTGLLGNESSQDCKGPSVKGLADDAFYQGLQPESPGQSLL